MEHTFDREAGARRIAAYNSFLLAAYDTDADGLAEIADVTRDDMAEYMAETDFGKLNCVVLSKLGNMTGISFSWLFAEQIGERPRNVRKDTYERPTIDYDDMRDTTVKVKACAAMLTELYTNNAGFPTYSDDLLEVMSMQLHEAARYLDGVLKTL